MKGISWQNFMMMNSVMPELKEERAERSKGPVQGSISLFDIGKRLERGEGV